MSILSKRSRNKTSSQGQWCYPKENKINFSVYQVVTQVLCWNNSRWRAYSGSKCSAFGDVVGPPGLSHGFSDEEQFKITVRVTSLVVQWLKICFPMQGTRVRSLVGELRSHMLQGNDAHVPQLLSPCTTTTESTCSGACKPKLESLHVTTTEPVHSGARAPQ